VCADEYKQLVDIEYIIQQHIERREIDGFTPAHQIEPSRAIRALKAKKPKKPKKPKEHHDGQRSGESASGHKVISNKQGQDKKRSPRANNNGNAPRKGRSGKPSSGNRPNGSSSSNRPAGNAPRRRRSTQS